MNGPRLRRLLRGLLLVYLCLLARPSLADPAQAKRSYARAMEQLKAGELRDARVSFEEAYRQSPHFRVLNNLGRVCLELGDRTAARDYLERYLEQGGDAIPPEERERVLELIASTRSAGTAAPVEPGSPPRRDTPLDPVPPGPPEAPVPAPLVAQTNSPTNATQARHRAPPPTVPLESLARERQTTLAITLGAVGTLMAAAGTGVLIWNNRRHNEYEATQAELAQPPLTGVSSQAELEQALQYARAHERNQADLDSVRQFDAVGWTLTGVGAALAATGVVLYLTRSKQTNVAVGVKSAELLVRVRY